MPKKRMDVNWKREIRTEDLKPAVKRYRRYLEDKGLKSVTAGELAYIAGGSRLHYSRRCDGVLSWIHSQSGGHAQN